MTGIKDREGDSLEETLEDWYIEYKDRSDILSLPFYFFGLFGFKETQNCLGKRIGYPLLLSADSNNPSDNCQRLKRKSF